MQCTACAKESLVEISMRVGESQLTFRRCGHCDTQAWFAADGAIPLARVLELAHRR